MRIRDELRIRVVTASSLLAITALAWWWMIDMAASGRHAIMSCCGISLPMTFVMWAVMMVGMMVPSAAPMVMLFASTFRRKGTPYAPVAAFVLGYLAIWTAFSLVAALAQWGLFHAGLLDPNRQNVAPWLAGWLLIAAGLFQLTPIKDACLRGCRSPVGFLFTDWREGTRGAFAMGLKHGTSCTGCCWLVMALLFVAGVMNLWWVALISAYVLAEKTIASPQFMRIAGWAFTVAGVLMLVAAHAS